MTVNHATEAQRYLSKASWMRGDGPDAQFVNPQTAAVLASLAQAHATLAHMPEQQTVTVDQLTETQRNLAATRRVVAEVIGETLVDGPAEAAGLARGLAYALRARRLSVDKQIAARMKELGSTYNPDAEVDEEQPVRAPLSTPSLDVETVLAVVVRQLVRMSTRWEDEVRRCARDFTRALDEVGFDIDRRMDELAQETGHGPYLCDMFGLRYDLTKQWADCNGKRWEHTGSWSDVGGPVMRRDEPDGDSMVLADLIRKRGPLYTVVPAPRSTVVREQELPPF